MEAISIVQVPAPMKSDRDFILAKTNISILNSQDFNEAFTLNKPGLVLGSLAYHSQ